MIAFLRGRLIEKHPNRLVVDVHGVGYDVQVPLSTFYDLAAPGEDVALRIHTHVREDQIALYGFATRLELDLFERLIGVGGIGPKIALAALSGIEPHELVRAVGSNDTRRLSSIPGIGKKTAERLLLELKGRLGADLPTPAGETPPTDAQGDIVQALLALGYNERDAKAALKALPPDIGVADGIRLALKALTR